MQGVNVQRWRLTSDGEGPGRRKATGHKLGMAVKHSWWRSAHLGKKIIIQVAAA